MRNPVATPASIIFGILILGFFLILLFSYITMTKETYVLEDNKASFIWGNAFLQFVDAFIALQCAGALIAYSLFLVIPPFHERKAFFRSLYSILISLLVFAALFVVCLEGFSPLIKKSQREARSLGLFSEALYKSALQKKDEGDIITALEYLRLSLSLDAENPAKITEKSLLISRLNDAGFQKYLALTNADGVRAGTDITIILERAQSALNKNDFTTAYTYARQVLALDNQNREALRIAAIAGEQSYKESAEQQGEADQYLYNRKKEGYAALRGDAGKDVITAYYIFLDLSRKFPLDGNVKEYLEESKRLLPSVSFFIRDAELVVSFQTLLKKNILFFNLFGKDERELVAIESMVTVGGETYLKNVEVLGFIRGNQILYHYTAPVGKIIGTYINLNGIDREDPSKRLSPQYLFGTPVIDRDKGIKLSVNPADLEYFALTKDDFLDRGTGELASMLPVLRNHAKMEELIILEIVLRMAKPFLLIILTLFSLSIGITQNARYLASPPKIIYVWVGVIPIVMITIMEIILFLYRMGVVFLYYTFGIVPGILIIAAVHIFFLIFGLVVFGKKFGVHMKR